MKLNEYQNLARETAIYPSGEMGLNYTLLGLIGEVGEFLANPGIDEYGDSMWYLSQSCWELGTPLNILDKAGRSTHKDLAHCVFSLANSYKKVFRDNGGVISGRKKQELLEILREVFFFLTISGLDLDEALEKNIEKLKSRKIRGKLQGSGDAR